MQHLTLDQIKDLLLAVPASCKGTSKMSVDRKRLMILVTFWHGLRASETCALRGRDIQHGYVKTKRLKGSHRCDDPYQRHPDPVLDEFAPLTALAAQVLDNELLFPMTRFGFHDFLKKAAIQAGINPKLAHPHILKHSLAMLMIPTGIEYTRQRLGHKNLSSTGFYLKVSSEDAAKALNKHLGI